MENNVILIVLIVIILFLFIATVVKAYNMYKDIKDSNEISGYIESSEQMKVPNPNKPSKQELVADFINFLVLVDSTNKRLEPKDIAQLAKEFEEAIETLESNKIPLYTDTITLLDSLIKLLESEHSHDNKNKFKNILKAYIRLYEIKKASQYGK